MAKAIHDGDAVRFGWSKATANLGLLLALTFGVGLVSIVLILITSLLFNVHWTLGFLFYLIFLAACYYLQFGFIKIMLGIVDGKKVGFEDMINTDVRQILNFVAVSLLYAMIVGVGFILLFVPGIVFMLKFIMAPFLVIDKNMGPIEALKKSNEMTDGVKWDLIGFFYVAQIVIMVGFAALGIGALLSIPTAVLAFIFVYRQLAGSGGAQKAA